MKIKVYYNRIALYFVKNIFASQNLRAIKSKDDIIAQKNFIYS